MQIKRKLSNGMTIVFFQNENDEKYSFLIENESELTEKLLSSVKTKRVKEKDIYYAVTGIADKIKEILESQEKTVTNQTNQTNMENPIVALSEMCQANFGENIETRVIGKSGEDHCPVITVEITLPNGKKFTASGSNQRIAKQAAANIALAEYE